MIEVESKVTSRSEIFSLLGIKPVSNLLRGHLSSSSLTVTSTAPAGSSHNIAGRYHLLSYIFPRYTARTSWNPTHNPSLFT